MHRIITRTLPSSTNGPAKLKFVDHEHVLDLGCGDGKVTAEIARQVPRGNVVGVDVSREMIEFARSSFGGPNVVFARADASALEFVDQFDVVFSNAALHWIRNHRPVLRGISRALKAGGRTLLQMGGRGNAVDVLAVIEEIATEPSWRKFFGDFQFAYGFYGPDDYRPWLVEAGLAAKRVELIPKDMTHDSLERFTGWLRTTWTPWIYAVDEDRRGKFIEEVVTRYVRTHPPDDHGRVHVKMVRLEVEATKH
jgi:trans-aconitate methyltransferase